MNLQFILSIKERCRKLYDDKYLFYYLISYINTPMPTKKVNEPISIDKPHVNKNILFLLYMKHYYSFIYRIKNILCYIFTFTYENIGSYKKLYGHSYIKYIPKIYYKDIFKDDYTDLVLYYIENKLEHKINFLPHESIQPVIKKLNINIKHSHTPKSSLVHYGYKVKNVGSYGLECYIRAGRFTELENSIHNVDNIDITIIYQLYRAKKFDIIEKNIHKVISIGNNKNYNNINFYLYLNKFYDPMNIIRCFYKHLNINYFIKINFNGFIDADILCDNVKLSYKIVKIFGTKYVCMSKLIDRLDFKYIMKLYNKKLINISDFKYNKTENSILFQILNGYKPILNELIRYSEDLIKLYINKYGTFKISDINLINSLDYYKYIDVVRAIKIGLKYGIELNFYKQIVGKKIFITFPNKIYNNSKLIKYYFSQLNRAGINYNCNEAFIEACKEKNIKLINAFDVKKLIKNKNILIKIFTNQYTYIINHIIDKKLYDMKWLLTYACKYNSSTLFRIVLKETICYNCGEHK